MPSGHADAADGDAHDGADLSLRNHPITLADIDHLLEVSADVERRGQGAPIRVWRDDLTLVLEALSYARAILSADLVILRQAGATGGEQAKRLLDDVPVVPGAGPEAGQSSHPTGGPTEPEPEPEPELSEDLFSRADQLLAAHQEMAEVDLTSAFDVAGSLAVIEEELAALTECQHQVEARLQEIRAAVIRQYQEGPGTARDQPA